MGRTELPRFGPEPDPAAVEQGFRRCGAAVFDALWPEARIAALLAGLIQACPQLGDEGLIEPARVQKVADRRYVVPVPVTAQTDCRDILLDPVLARTFAAVLGPDWVIESVGAIVSFPGARRQGVHRDSEPLFGGIAIEPMLPAFALTLAVPLRGMDAALGSTGFWPGTHIYGVEPEGDEPQAVPEVPVGSAAVWNYRISHCGMENRSTLPRPLLYVTVCRPFWHEYANDTPTGDFGIRMERALIEDLSPEDRQRFRRAKAA